MPQTMIARFQRINEMIIMPLIALFMFFNSFDLFTIASSGVSAYRTWMEWIEFTDLSYTMQRMRLRMAQLGGPFITTNDAKYMPYVWADAVVRYEG
jgi:hypothetical protein